MGPQDKTISIFCLNGTEKKNNNIPNLTAWEFPANSYGTPKSWRFVSDDFRACQLGDVFWFFRCSFSGVNTHDSPNKNTPPHHLDLFQWCFFSAESQVTTEPSTCCTVVRCIFTNALRPSNVSSRGTNTCAGGEVSQGWHLLLKKLKNGKRTSTPPETQHRS